MVDPGSTIRPRFVQEPERKFESNGSLRILFTDRPTSLSRDRLAQNFLYVQLHVTQVASKRLGPNLEIPSSTDCRKLQVRDPPSRQMGCLSPCRLRALSLVFHPLVVALYPEIPAPVLQVPCCTALHMWRNYIHML
jgi:hypothetical protein